MTSSYSIFNPISIIPTLPLTIECMDVWGEQLVIGTQQGVLLRYLLAPSSTGRSPYQMNIKDAKRGFAKKAILQLQVLERCGVIVTMSEAFVHVHELPSFKPKATLNKTKGCHLFAVDAGPERRVPVMCVAVKKKLFVFKWDGASFTEEKQLNLSDVPKAIRWADANSVCVAFKKEYRMVNVVTGEEEIRFPTGKSGHPLMTGGLPDSQMLLGKDSLSVIVGQDGKPTQKFSLSWSEPPLGVGYASPFAIALLSKHVEVATIVGTHRMLQSIPLKSKVLALSTPSQPGSTPDIYVAASTQVWRLVPLDPSQLVDQMVEGGDFKDAISMCRTCLDGGSKQESRLHNMRVMYAYYRFAHGEYAKAMKLFHKLDSNPVEVISLFPSLLPQTLAVRFVARGGKLVGTRANLEGGLSIAVPAIVRLSTSEMDEALEHLVNYLTLVRSSVPPRLELRSPDFASTSDPVQLIDTALLKAYLRTNDALVGPLLRLPNHCHVGEAERVLLENEKYNELVVLYKGNRLLHKALSLLSKLGQGGMGASNPRAVGHLRGPGETIKFLRHLGKEHLSLILEFSAWLLRDVPEEALTIFAEQRPNDEQLPIKDVLNHIQKLAPQLTVPYLEWVIADCNNTDADCHNELIFNYLDIIVTLKRDEKSMRHMTGGRVTAGNEPGMLGKTRKKLLIFLEKSPHYTPEKMLSRFPFDDLSEERAILLSRIGQHERALDIYVHKLRDPDQAERYCARHYDDVNRGEESASVYLSLLRVLLDPTKGGSSRSGGGGVTSGEIEAPLLQRALDILNRYHTRIDTAKAMELLPSDLSVQSLYPFLELVLKHSKMYLRSQQVVKNLLKSENLQVHEDLIRAHSRVIVVEETRTCPACNMRLGTSAFYVYPNNVVVHFGCGKEQDVCPITGERFSIEKPDRR
eukprot:TRINITY_DN3647_c0_g1_i2.p1 TRINITY_DN3647_c0_g1~~TRINITY_DN3647_c0_g1_i2.p1  ORF type:complete len:916 (-),score=175.96 TRINITY_DN3647_c0_g1_i2:3010-5757(-)